MTLQTYTLICIGNHTVSSSICTSEVFKNLKLYKPLQRVSMGLTVSRKTTKNLAVKRKNERILTVSRKKC